LAILVSKTVTVRLGMISKQLGKISISFLNGSASLIHRLEKTTIAFFKGVKKSQMI